ncbi:Signal transduction histidine kinase [Gracilibacillus orientalis]|uniref:histidine kinase n=1 Tax=Gracilibacillus orientalis TaxID=334253 RepID=A0A1I4HQM9_9BACI|nr:histidine kinase [Gracilibacillus orientalis]SFL44628.1 Signal transduction histidine kinase [Gracilibacillus orientalis]
MKKTYFMWIAIHCLVWPLAFLGLDPLSLPKLASFCLFLIILFIIPLFSEKPLIQTILCSIQALTLLIIFYPADHDLIQFLLLVQALVIAEAIFRLPLINSMIVMVVQFAGLLWLLTQTALSTYQLAWTILFYILVIIGLSYFQFVKRREVEVQKKNDVLLDEYRKMKRQLVTEEENTRQDERMLIGHEIHDSVGHKLTALLMQLEAFRLTADEKDKKKVEKLKELAEQSLEETRRAVKSFKQNEVGGLQGLIRLIRKLEMEKFMKINFSVKHGAFAASLTGEQSFAIYRAVQEALTNIIKHSSSREAYISFEAPGGSIFRFEVMNPAKASSFFQEGYGLIAMRERLEKVGGSLEIHHDERQFAIRGSIRITERRV